MSLFAIAMLFLQGTINQLPSGQTGGPETDFIAQMEAIQTNQFLTNLIFGGCNVIVGSLLVQQTAIAIPPARESSQSSYLVFFLATFLVAVFFVF